MPDRMERDGQSPQAQSAPAGQAAPASGNKHSAFHPQPCPSRARARQIVFRAVGELRATAAEAERNDDKATARDIRAIANATITAADIRLGNIRPELQENAG